MFLPYGSYSRPSSERFQKYQEAKVAILIHTSLFFCSFFRWIAGEDEKYDLEYSVKLRDLQIQELEMEVSDMRGKFIIPKLKKVHAFKLMGNEEG